jgi:hypothetical protein
MTKITTGVAVVLAAVVAGCGGGSSKEDYVAEADKICREAATTFSKLEEELSGIGEGATSEEAVLEEARDVFAKAAEEARPFADDLADLEAPDDLEDQADRYVATVRESVAAIEDASKVESVEELQQVGEKLGANDAEQQKLGQEIGFKDCTDAS